MESNLETEIHAPAAVAPIARRDFTVRLAELVIQLVAIIGATAVGLGISAYFSAHRYVTAYLVSYAAFRFADLLMRDQTALGLDSARFARRMIYELPLLALFFGAPFERTFIYGGEVPRWLGTLGLLIELAGIWLVLGARIQRVYFCPGDNRDSHRMLIRSGLYRFIRHPIYTGEFLVMLGLPFEYGAPITLLIAAALGFIFVNQRIRREEADMMAEHGDAYTDYMRTTDRMIPNLW
ncbi:MAG: isoprenylcysteine carboxylmethyltransferase family protein [Deltaproteobacteria bacterium]|nr:isoprenylcysteine carboxylmethyltransferase family protein [Deltaproteobacteria bacterium]